MVVFIDSLCFLLLRYRNEIILPANTNSAWSSITYRLNTAYIHKYWYISIISSGDDGLLQHDLQVKDQLKKGRPISNTGKRTTRRREHYKDKKNLDAAVKKVAERKPGADAEFAKCLQTSAGHQRYPALANPIQGNAKLQTLVKAMAGTLHDLHAVKPVANALGLGAAASAVLPAITRNSAVAAPLVAMLISHAPDLKPAEFAQHLGLNPGYVRTAMFQAKQRADSSGKPTVLDIKQDNQREVVTSFSRRSLTTSLCRRRACSAARAAICAGS